MLAQLTATHGMVQMTVKKELGLDDAEADDRLIQLANLLPGLLPRLPTIKAKTVVTLAQDITVSCCALLISCHCIQNVVTRASLGPAACYSPRHPVAEACMDMPGLALQYTSMRSAQVP